jgi:hypothetical protein
VIDSVATAGVEFARNAEYARAHYAGAGSGLAMQNGQFWPSVLGRLRCPPGLTDWPTVPPGACTIAGGFQCFSSRARQCRSCAACSPHANGARPVHEGTGRHSARARVVLPAPRSSCAWPARCSPSRSPQRHARRRTRARNGQAWSLPGRLQLPELAADMARQPTVAWDGPLTAGTTRARTTLPCDGRCGPQAAASAGRTARDPLPARRAGLNCPRRLEPAAA